MNEDESSKIDTRAEVAGELEIKAAASGSKLDENYELLGQIGAGGMGSVEKARHKILGQFVAVKRIRESKSSDAAAHNRFINEARAASRLKHANLAGLREFGIDFDGSPYAVMDFIDGEDLSSLIKQGKTQNDPKRVLEIAAQVAEGLDHAHKNGIVHRDIKPSNIIISSTDEGKDCATIVDFGIAKIMEADGQRLTQTGEIFGSPFYLSPEQAIGNAIDHRTDIYSLACVIYECLCGTPPFVGENPMQTAMKHLNEKIPSLSQNSKVPLPAGLADLVETCLQKDPENRYKSCAELALALRAILEGRKLKSVGKINIRQKFRIWIYLANALLLLTLICVVYLSSIKSREKDPFDELKISELAKVALKVDMRRSAQEYSSGAYEKSAHSLLGTNLILDKELKDLERKFAASKSRKEKRALSYAKTCVLDYKQQNLVHIAMCYARCKQFEEAADYFEQALPYYRHYAELWSEKIQKEKVAPPPRELATPNPIVELYEYYIQLLQDIGNKSRLQELETEYAKMRKSLSWGTGYLLIKRPWPSEPAS